MFFATFATLAMTAASMVSANSMTFINQDSKQRLLVVTPNAGHAAIDSVTVAGHDEATIEFPQGWIGNIYSVTDGNENNPGMLAEVAYQGAYDLTYFDVSAIVDPNDHDGVKEMYPQGQADLDEKTKYSGCKVFPCNTAYYLPDDVQTVTTPDVDIICTLGNPTEVEARDTQPSYVARDYVLGKR
jgi:hypothetical protein